MSEWWWGPMSASMRRRARRRKVLRYMVPTLHPAEDRWRRAALGDHECRPFTVYLTDPPRAAVPADPAGAVP